MGYVFQFMIISGFTLLGELLHNLLPLPVPSSVYGMILLFIALLVGIVKEEQIKETADFLLLTMPIMFIGPSVGIIENFANLSNHLLAFVVVIFITTLLVMIITGFITQKIILFEEKREKANG